MTTADAFLTNCRLADGRLVDIGIADGKIAIVGEGVAPALSNSAPALDIGGDLVLPGLVDGHMHLDKTLTGLPWMGHAAGPTRMSRIETDKTILPHLPLSTEERSAAYPGGGNGSRTGSGLIFARIAFNVRMRGDNGNRSPSIMSSSALSRAAVSSSVRPGIINQWPRVRSETGRQQGALTNSGNLSQGKRDERNRHRQSARPAMPLHTRAN